VAQFRVKAPTDHALSIKFWETVVDFRRRRLAALGRTLLMSANSGAQGRYSNWASILGVFEAATAEQV
jgi:hypothetical protein